MCNFCKNSENSFKLQKKWYLKILNERQVKKVHLPFRNTTKVNFVLKLVHLRGLRKQLNNWTEANFYGKRSRVLHFWPDNICGIRVLTTINK